MKIFRDITGFITVAGLIVAGVFVIAASWWNADDWKYYARLMGDNRPVLAIAGIAYILLAVLMVVIRFYRRSGDYLSFDREGGRVSIATKVIEDYISRLAAEFPAITRMQPKVIAARESVDVFVDVRIKAGPQIKEICEILQQRVRDSMFSGLGIAQVRYVEVNVQKIIGQTEPDMRSISEEEGL